MGFPLYKITIHFLFCKYSFLLVFLSINYIKLILYLYGDVMQYIHLPDVNLYHIQIFLEVVKIKNITHAANNLFITQSMVSKTIQNFENTIGLQLFIRQYNKLQVTPAGIALYDELLNC